MPADVGQRLLGDAVERHLGLGGQRYRPTDRLDPSGHTVQLGPPLGVRGERLGQPRALQGTGLQGLDGAAGLAEALAGQRPGQTEVPLLLGGRPLGGRLELRDDPGQALGDRVVDLPGQPLPLLAHSRVAGLDDELVVQGGVLGHRLLQPLVGERRARRWSPCAGRSAAR